MVGHDIRLLLTRKLQDYMHPGWEKFVRRDKLVQAGDFINDVVVLFEQKVHAGALDTAGSRNTPPPR